MLASETGAKECVEFLSRVGADVNLQDHKGVTALMLALSGSYPDIAELLLLPPQAEGLVLPLFRLCSCPP